MEQKHPIDELFKNGTQKEYPFDEQLWNNVVSELPSKSDSKPFFWVFNLNGLLLLAMLGISTILYTDTPLRTSTEQLLSDDIIPSKEETPIADENSLVIPSKTKKEFSNQTASPIQLSPKTIENTVEKNAEQDSPIAITDVESIKTDDISTSKNIDLFVFDPMESSGLMLPLKKKKYVPKTGAMEFKHLGSNKIYSELEFNFGLNQKKSLEGLPKEVLDFRSRNEKIISSRNMGVNFFKDYKFIQLGLGIHISQFQEKLNYQVDAEGVRSELNYDTSYTIVNGNYNQNGVPVLLIKENIASYMVDKEYRYQKDIYLKNKFQRLQVPIFIGIHKNFGNLYFNLRSALLLDYTYVQSGSYLANSMKRIDAFENRKQLNSFVLGNAYSASAGYSINEFIVLGARFNFEKDLSSYTKGYSSKMEQYGLGVWLMWKPF